MGDCTFIKPFKKWFDERFGDLCTAHDAAYVKRIWRDKVAGDFALSAGFAERGYITLCYSSLLFMTVFGTLFWLWKGRK